MTQPDRQIRRRPSFFHHLHPPAIPAAQARFRHTLAAGGLSVFLTLVVAVTGILETFYYVPTPGEAALSIQSLVYFVPYGSLVRGLHFWSAQALVGTASIHLLRVILTGAYARPRRFNYLLGLGLLVLILFLDFSGYVLRWDESVRWALVAGTNLIESIPILGPALYRWVVGGVQPGSATLLRFYAWHLFGLTVALGVLLAWHIFRVRRDGGIAVPADSGNPQGPAARIHRDELVRREMTAALLALAALLLAAALLPVPIASPMSITGSLSGEARAPWFFLWVQQLLKWGDPFLLGVLTPAGILAGLASIPYLFPSVPPQETGRWLPRRARLAQILAAIIFIFILSLTAISLVESGLPVGALQPTPTLLCDASASP